MEALCTYTSYDVIPGGCLGCLKEKALLAGVCDCHCGRGGRYKDAVEMQMRARDIAHAFNALNPPKKIDVVEI